MRGDFRVPDNKKHNRYFFLLCVVDFKKTY